MKNNKDLVQKLSTEISVLQKKIDNPTWYNLRNHIMSSLLKIGVAVDYALPFILAYIYIFNSSVFKDDTPFYRDILTNNPTKNFEFTQLNTNAYSKHNFVYDDIVLEYSTAWKTNYDGSYERTVTSYKLNMNVDLSDLKKVLSLSKDEIDNLLVISDIKTIKKSTFDKNDFIFKTNCLILIENENLDDECVIRLESTRENIINSILYIIIASSFGINFSFVESILIKRKPRDKYREYAASFRPLNKKELKNMKKIMELKKQNLNMLINSGSDQEERISKNKIFKM